MKLKDYLERILDVLSDSFVDSSISDVIHEFWKNESDKIQPNEDYRAILDEYVKHRLISIGYTRFQTIKDRYGIDHKNDGHGNSTYNDGHGNDTRNNAWGNKI